MYSKEDNSSTYSSKSSIIKSWYFILILLFIVFDNTFQDQSSELKSFTILIVSFFVYSTIIDLWLLIFENIDKRRKIKES